MAWNEATPASPEIEVAEMPPEEAPATTSVVIASQAYAVAKPGIATWQVVSTVAVFLGMLGAVPTLGANAYWLILPLAGTIVRIFVLQHDCGHLGLFSTRQTNDRVGLALSFLTGVPYHAWRVEHNWHHAHQAKLTRRGVDSNNSPMTLAEARADTGKARLISRFVSPLTIFGSGALSLVVMHKHLRGYFFAEKAFRWPIPDKPGLLRSIRLNNLVHHPWLLAIAFWLGPWMFALVYLPALITAAGIGGLLFWIQHNFEHTFFGWDEEWSFERAGLQGSSYLWLPPVLSWFTAHIGIHHVHHINVRIPNYRLDEARRGLPELAAVAPLSASDIWKCFRHLFWDEGNQRLVPISTVLEP